MRIGAVTHENGRWFERQRREWITETLHVFGYINRDHLIRKFGISSAQASIDINRYLKRRPDSMTYNTSLKRYEAKP